MHMHNMPNTGSAVFIMTNRAHACLYTVHNCITDAWATAGAVQLQAQRAAGAPRVSHPGVPGQVLLPPHGHHEQACLRCHPDALPPQACPGLRLFPPSGVLLHLAHCQGILHAIKAFLHTTKAFCTLRRHFAHYEGILHTMKAFCILSRHLAH